MALVKPFIFQVVGYKNSGKTTIVTDVIRKLRSDKLDVVAIKHHGHGGKPEASPNTDSSRQLDSGAIAAMVEGDGSLLLQAQKTKWTLEEKIQLASFFQPDLILIEGHKTESFPKLVLLRNKHDIELIRLSNVQAVIAWEETLDYAPKDMKAIPWFTISDPGAIEWLHHYLKSQL